MTAAGNETATSAPTDKSFGERWGWLLGAIWVVFLAYPLIGALEADVPEPVRIIGVLLVVLFGGVYIAALAWLDRVPARRRVGWTWIVFMILILLVLALLPTIRIGVLGMVPYLVSFAFLGLPRAAGLATFALGIAATIVVPAIAGQLGSWWFLILIVVLTGFTTLFIRVMEDREAESEIVREQLAVVAERERVARDVHDVLGHSLTVVTVKAELAERLMDADPERTKAELRQIQSLTRQALAEIRATVGGLRVARLADELVAAREALSAAGIVPVVPDDAEAVDPRYRIIFAWALRETITNVVRHSRANRCEVHLAERQMTVVDDGVGLPAGVTGNGLRGIRERVEAASGRLELITEPDVRGTTVKVAM